MIQAWNIATQFLYPRDIRIVHAKGAARLGFFFWI